MKKTHDTNKLIKAGFENVYQYNATIGKHGTGGRVCLWTNKLADIGFGWGQHIEITPRPYDHSTGDANSLPQRLPGIDIIKAKAGRKVSRVMNKGAYRPVIDLKQTATIDIASLAYVGDEVTVTLWKHRHGANHKNHITIQPKA